MTNEKQIMQSIAQALDGVLNEPGRPKQNGFVVLVFPLDGPDGARTNYVSNCDRKEIVAALKEVVARFDGQPYQEGNG